MLQEAGYAKMDDQTSPDRFQAQCKGEMSSSAAMIPNLHRRLSWLATLVVVGCGTAVAAETEEQGRRLFVPAGTRIDAALRTKAGDRPILAEPAGYPYFYMISTGSPTAVPAAPAVYPWQGRALRGWAVAKGGSPAGYHIAVNPGGRFVVALGFF